MIGLVSVFICVHLRFNLLVRFCFTAKGAKGAKEEGVDKNLLRVLRVLRGLI
jgi:hypothetical protein